MLTKLTTLIKTRNRKRTLGKPRKNKKKSYKTPKKQVKAIVDVKVPENTIIPKSANRNTTSVSSEKHTSNRILSKGEKRRMAKQKLELMSKFQLFNKKIRSRRQIIKKLLGLHELNQ